MREGAQVAQLVKCLLLAQVMILGSWDPAPTSGSLLNGESASPSALPPLLVYVRVYVCVCVCSLFQINKILKKKRGDERKMLSTLA